MTFPKPPPWAVEAYRLAHGEDDRVEAFEAALLEAGWKPNRFQPAYIRRLQNAWRKPLPKNPAPRRPKRWTPPAPKPMGRPRRALGSGKPLEQAKRNLAYLVAIEIDGERKRTGKSRVARHTVLPFIRKAIPDFINECKAELDEGKYDHFAQAVYDMALKTGRFKILKR
jgi:hypothetical protein